MASTSACRGGFQSCIVQHRRHHLRAKAWRAGVVAAHGGLQLTQHAARGFAVFTDHGQTADALPVQRENFGERVADQHRHPGAGDGANGVGISSSPPAKAPGRRCRGRGSADALSIPQPRGPTGLASGRRRSGCGSKGAAAQYRGPAAFAASPAGPQSARRWWLYQTEG